MEWTPFLQLIIVIIILCGIGRMILSYMSNEPFFGKQNCESFFPKHNWGKWKNAGTYKIFNPITDKQIQEGIVQERKCSICDIAEFKHTSMI